MRATRIDDNKVFALTTVRTGIFSLLVSVGTLAGCSSSPEPLHADAPVLSVCDAALESLGTRIAVRGEFDGGVGRQSFFLRSEELCSERGAGLVLAETASEDEMSKVFTVNPRRSYRPGGLGSSLETFPGDLVTVEGTVVEDTITTRGPHRTTLEQVIVRSVQRRQ